MEEVLVRELVGSVGRMLSFLEDYEANERLDPKEAQRLLVRASSTACSLLRNSTYVEALITDAQTLSRAVRERRGSVREITEAGHFEYFLNGERDLLEAAGADPRLMEEVISRCREARERAGKGEFDVVEFRAALDELRSVVCDAFAELEQAAVDDQGRRRLGRRLRSGFRILCGALMVGLDASSLAASAGLTAAGVAVSGALGGAIVGDALSALRLES